MERLFYICFIIGIVYIVLSFILGGVLDFLNIGGDIDLGFEFPFASLLQPAILATFLTVFGGTGLFGINKGWKYVIIIALIAGILMAYLIWRGIFVNLKKAENTSSIGREELIGTEALVIETILKNGMGAITYSVHGNKYSSPAKSIEGNEVKKGAKVIITKIEHSIFYVIALKDN